MRKIHDHAVLRRRCARRMLAAAASGLVVILGRGAHADDVWQPKNNPTNWNVAAWWSGGVPTGGTVVDIYTLTCNMNVTNTGDLAAVQVAGGATLSLNTAGDTLETQALAVGGTLAGTTGSGTLSQSAGTLIVDGGGTFGVDPISTYSLGGSGIINSGANEQLAGSFGQTNGTNQLANNLTLSNSGLYGISGSGASVFSDTYVNTGSFNQTGGTLEGSTSNGSAGTFSFNNSGTYYYTAGNFYGVMNNSGNAQVNATTVPFGLGVINNGALTINGSTGTYSGAITGGANGELYFKGATNLTLSGTNIYFGTTVINSGTLLLGSPAGNSSNNYGGCLRGPITIQNGATLQNLGGSQVSGLSPVSINGGTYNLNGYDNSVFSLNLNAGRVTTNTTGPGIGINSSASVPGLIASTGASSITGGIRCTYGLQFNVSGNTTLTVTGLIGNYTTSLPPIPLTLTGGGTLSVSGASRLNTINISSGTLTFNEGGNLGGQNTSVAIQNGGALSLSNQSLTIGDLTGVGSSTVNLGTGNLTVNTINGSAYPGTFIGSGSLTETGTNTLTLTGNEASSGPVNVNGGTLTMASGSNLSSGNVNVASGATLNLDGTLTTAPVLNINGTVNIPQQGTAGITQVTFSAVSIGTVGGSAQMNLALATPHVDRTLLEVNSLSFGGGSGAWVGQLDLSNNDLVIHNSNFASVFSQVKSGFANGSWNGFGITSTAAAADTTHLTAIGVISNDLGGGTPLYGGANSNPFDGTYPVATDVLLKYTYYGDANLDGQVNSADYALIDGGFLGHLTGWYNGDFNYDGVVNGSDYTLIDNAFNTQGANLSTSAEIAASTAQLAGSSSVPEPASGLVAMAVVGASSLRRRRRG